MKVNDLRYRNVIRPIGQLESGTFVEIDPNLRYQFGVVMDFDEFGKDVTQRGNTPVLHLESGVVDWYNDDMEVEVLDVELTIHKNEKVEAEHVEA